MVPTLKSISAKNGKYIPVNKMRAKPGKKEVEEGIGELKTVLAADGRWARETGTRKTPLDAYGHITMRMKELVDESDWPAMERKYYQLSGRKWERGHVLDIDHMEASIREVISKNSGEDAIKAFSKLRFSEMIGISKHVVKMAEMVDEFFQRSHTL